MNPDFELKASGMKMGGGPKQFGVDAEVVPALLDEIGKRGLAFEGFHLYAGSQNLKAESICEAQVKSYELALRLAQSAPAPVKVLNLGGGFGIPYFPGDTRLDLGPIGANLAMIVARATTEMPQARIVIELGRYLVGEAGIYVCRVVDRKVSRGQVFLVTDGGLHHHLAASGNFGQVIRKNYPACIGNRVVGTAREKANIVGPLCTPLDVLADQMDLAVAEPGDLVVVFQSGDNEVPAGGTRLWVAMSSSAVDRSLADSAGSILLADLASKLARRSASSQRMRCVAPASPRISARRRNKAWSDCGCTVASRNALGPDEVGGEFAGRD